MFRKQKQKTFKLL